VFVVATDKRERRDGDEHSVRPNHRYDHELYGVDLHADARGPDVHVNPAESELLIERFVLVLGYEHVGDVPLRHRR
jgi:hypothetical protein